MEFTYFLRTNSVREENVCVESLLFTNKTHKVEMVKAHVTRLLST